MHLLLNTDIFFILLSVVDAVMVDDVMIQSAHLQATIIVVVR